MLAYNTSDNTNINEKIAITDISKIHHCNTNYNTAKNMITEVFNIGFNHNFVNNT